MYFREKTTTNGVLLQLVRGSRGLDGKVRQQVILSLGGCVVPDALRRETAHLVENILLGQQDLFAPSAEVAKWADLLVDRIRSEGKLDLVRHSVTRPVPEGSVADGVLLDSVAHGESRQLGVLLPLHKAWESLGLTDFLSSGGMNARRIRAAQVCVFNRLVEPCSENELQDWVGTMAFDELLGDTLCHYGRDVFYRAGDDLLERGKADRKSTRLNSSH